MTNCRFPLHLPAYRISNLGLRCMIICVGSSVGLAHIFFHPVNGQDSAPCDNISLEPGEYCRVVGKEVIVRRVLTDLPGEKESSD